MRYRVFTSFFSLFTVVFSAMSQVSFDFSTAQRGPIIGPLHYGIFYEEINHAGDGGLYAELKYTNYLRGSLWQKYVETIPDDDNSISFILSVTSNEPETPGFRSPVKPTATSSTTR